MASIPQNLCVPPGTSIRLTLEAITKNGRQVALVTDPDDRLLGIVTDGDVRKALLRGASLDAPIGPNMNATPITGRAGLGRSAATELMRARGIRHLPLVDGAGRLADVVFLDDVLARVPLPAAAVIMAGGMGTRLRPLTEETPKPLLRVGGRPLIEILIERLERSGIGHVLVAVHHKSEMIREALGDGARLGVRLSYVDEPERLGTIGALSLIRPRPAEPFFVINADILTKCDFRAMWEFHRAEGARMTVGVSLHQVDIPYGEFTLHGTRISRVEEKPRKEFPVNAGIYLLDPSLTDLIPAGQYFDATDLIRACLQRELPVSAYLIREYWLDVGRHDDLRRADRDVAEGLLD
ncbi:MAG TPA: nucleotidyltransferase family protein [Methylomirabilota bacterium]|jgi:dTDP-glucose pyrophosphorylase|nr:nucleotidyltransferase family protein [Methylomirabilota bacterium]